MMATQDQQITRTKCILCGSNDLSEALVTYGDGSKESVKVCQNCGHYHSKDTRYEYIVSGLGKNWSSPDDLKATIEEILRANLPDDVINLSVVVAEVI